jgi:hypothetical protein
MDGIGRIGADGHERIGILSVLGMTRGSGFKRGDALGRQEKSFKKDDMITDKVCDA